MNSATIVGNRPGDRFEQFEGVTIVPRQMSRPVQCIIKDVIRWTPEMAAQLAIARPLGKTLDDLREPTYVLGLDSETEIYVKEHDLLQNNPRPCALLPASTPQPA